MSNDKEKYIVSADMTIKETIELMERELIKAVVVTDDNETVMGLFSNGDMRSFFLRGGALSDKVITAMNRTPVLFYSVEEVERERREHERVIYPIVDRDKRLVRVIDDDKRGSEDIISDALSDIPLVIMAGGKGTRLYPYTKILPKPLIPIGDVTITERIIDSFRRYGCRKVYMVLNHKAGMIRAYMSELEKDYDIEFILEEEFLGTAGGLRLMKDRLKSTFIMSNCDIVINDDIECVYNTHRMKGNKITFICSMKDMTIPYGVVETTPDGKIRGMKEKPELSFLINTGVYMIEPEVLDSIEDNEFIHMPDLATRCIENGANVGVFPISENAWLDMGQISEMKKMMQTLGV